MAVTCQFEQEFDPNAMYQYVNHEISVMHCHHYATLFTRLALDMKSMDGPRFLREAMEESSYLTLQRLYIAGQVTEKKDRLDIAMQYFGLAGLGQLEMRVERGGGTARMIHSHVDEGWIKKWQKEKEPVNFIGQGYILAAVAAIHDKPIGSYKIEETKSIVKGDRNSEFTIHETKAGTGWQ